ncbi:MAG: hypothetical protein AAB413_03225 [Patescibacteria group bacterium]
MLRRHKEYESRSSREDGSENRGLKIETENHVEFPEQFNESAREVAHFLSLLDADPDEAIKDPKIERFVSQLANTGFIGGVYIRHTPFFRGPAPKIALPRWLHQDFLQRHSLESLEELTSAERKEIGQLYKDFVRDYHFHDSEFGRYYEVEKQSEVPSVPQDYKYYIESKDLLNALRSGKLEEMLNTLATLKALPASFKLFEGSRFVLYFRGAVSSDSVTNVLNDLGVKGRGPAHDVYEIIQQDGRVELRSAQLSNDSALGDGGRNPVEYTEPSYDPKHFLETYLRLCLYAGKNPAEPYKTSFVYFISPEDVILERGVVDEARALTDYPVVIVPSRRTAIKQRRD